MKDMKTNKWVFSSQIIKIDSTGFDFFGQILDHKAQPIGDYFIDNQIVRVRDNESYESYILGKNIYKVTRDSSNNIKVVKRSPGYIQESERTYEKLCLITSGLEFPV